MKVKLGVNEFGDEELNLRYKIRKNDHIKEIKIVPSKNIVDFLDNKCNSVFFLLLSNIKCCHIFSEKRTPYRNMYKEYNAFSLYLEESDGSCYWLYTKKNDPKYVEEIAIQINSLTGIPVYSNLKNQSYQKGENYSYCPDKYKSKHSKPFLFFSFYNSKEQTLIEFNSDKIKKSKRKNILYGLGILIALYVMVMIQVIGKYYPGKHGLLLFIYAFAHVSIFLCVYRLDFIVSFRDTRTRIILLNNKLKIQMYKGKNKLNETTYYQEDIEKISINRIENGQVIFTIKIKHQTDLINTVDEKKSWIYSLVPFTAPSLNIFLKNNVIIWSSSKISSFNKTDFITDLFAIEDYLQTELQLNEMA